MTRPRLVESVTDFVRSVAPPASDQDRRRSSRTRKAGIGILTIDVMLSATCLAAVDRRRRR